MAANDVMDTCVHKGEFLAVVIDYETDLYGYAWKPRFTTGRNFMRRGEIKHKTIADAFADGKRSINTYKAQKFMTTVKDDLK